MKYQHRSFQVSMYGSPSDSYTHARAVCRDSGHMSTDIRGKCLRCGELPAPTITYTLEYYGPDDTKPLVVLRP